jgi:hypothetical protein
MNRFAIAFAIGAGMAHILSIVNSRTIVTEQNGIQATITLAGVVVPPPDEATAADFLRRQTTSGWVLVEPDRAHPGEAWLYRSPDGLFVNGEMMRAAYRDGGAHMTYLGESSPAAHEATPKRATTAAARPAPQPRPRPRSTHHVKR